MKRYIKSDTSLQQVREAIANRDHMGIFRLLQDPAVSHEALAYALSEGEVYNVAESPNLTDDLADQIIADYGYKIGVMARLGIYHPEYLDEVRARLREIASMSPYEYKKIDQYGKPYHLNALKSNYPEFYSSVLAPIFEKKQSTAKGSIFTPSEIADSISSIAPGIAEDMYEISDDDMMTKDQFIDYLKYQVENYSDELEFDSDEDYDRWIKNILRSSIFS